MTELLNPVNEGVRGRPHGDPSCGCDACLAFDSPQAAAVGSAIGGSASQIEMTLAKRGSTSCSCGRVHEVHVNPDTGASSVDTGWY